MQAELTTQLSGFFIFFPLRQGLPNLLRLALDLQSSCLS